MVAGFVVLCWANIVGNLFMVAGFVVLCWANTVGNIISAEKRCNYPGRSRVTQLVTYMPASNESKLGLILTLHCSWQKAFGRNVFSRVDDGWANVV